MRKRMKEVLARMTGLMLYQYQEYWMLSLKM